MTIYSLSGLLTAITSGLMTGLMLFIAKKRLHYLWAVFCFAVFLFGLGVYFVGGSPTAPSAAFWWKFAHLGAITIPVLFLHFVYEFLELKKDRILVIIYIITFLYLVADVSGNLFIDHMRFAFGQFYYDSPAGLFYPSFTILFFGLTAYSHLLLWRGYKASNDRYVKDKIKIFFLGMGVSFAGGGFNFLPVYGIDIYPYLNLSVCFYPLIISYAIVKHQLFDIKLIFVEFAIMLLNLFMFINIFTSHTQSDYILNISVFIVVIAFSVYLIQGIYNEIRDRERIEELVWEKARANDRLRTMEVQKTEFVSIASHQLRTPLTVIKGYASMILEGTFGEISLATRDVMEKLYKSTAKLVTLVEDLLTVSRIEQGRTVINFEKINLKKCIQELIAEMEPESHEAKIYLSFSMEAGSDPLVYIDEKKFKQAIRRIIENSIKYTVGPGFVYISISFDHVARKVRLSISDMGAGMTTKQIEGIFERFNLNSVIDEHSDASGVDTQRGERGQGIGLYIAQEIIEAHHGVLRIESSGLKTGTTVVVELPQASVAGLLQN